jgi:small subunit ribosomal protein S2
MKPYIFGARNGIHILDLSQTVPLFARALGSSRPPQAGGKVLFVGTKRQAQEPIAQAARFGPALRQPPLAGRHAHQLEDDQPVDQAFQGAGRTACGRHRRSDQKEVLQLTRERDKFELSLGGIRDMGGIRT